MKNSKSNQISFATISKFRLVVGVTLGLCYAFLLYAFQVLLREILRISSTTEYNEIWVLSHEEIAFYNWFYAALALLIGQSICFGFWFARPKRYNEYGIGIKSALLNDQIVLQGNFLMWALKLGFVFALFFGLTIPNAHLTFSFYPEFALLPVLIIITLFFQSWKTIRLKWRKNSTYWMIVTFFGLIVSSWGLSKIDLVDYKSLNDKLLKQNVWITNDMQIPVIDAGLCDQNFDPSIASYLFCRIPEDSSKILIKHKNQTAIYEVDAPHFPFLDTLLLKSNAPVDVRLYIDKRLKMGIVSTILSHFKKDKARSISYAVLPINHEFPIAAYHGFELKDEYLMGNIPELKMDVAGGFTNLIRIEHLKPNEIMINGKQIRFERLEDELYKQLKRETFIAYRYSNSITYDDYIQLLVTIKTVIGRQVEP